MKNKTCRQLISTPAQEIALDLAKALWCGETLESLHQVLSRQPAVRRERIRFLASKAMSYWRGELSLSEVRQYFPPQKL